MVVAVQSQYRPGLGQSTAFFTSPYARKRGFLPRLKTPQVNTDPYRTPHTPPVKTKWATQEKSKSAKLTEDNAHAVTMMEASQAQKNVVKKNLTKKQIAKRKFWCKILAMVTPPVGASGKSLKDSFGAMALYALISIGALKLIPSLLTPWVGAGVALLMVALFLISLGMEGKALYIRTLKFLYKRNGLVYSDEPKPLKPINGKMKRAGFYIAIGLSRFFQRVAPWTAAICKGISGMGGTAGCLLMIFSSAGVIASTAIIGPVPWVIISVSGIFGLALAGLSRYKEGEDFIDEAKSFEAKSWDRLNLKHNREPIVYSPTLSQEQRYRLRQQRGSYNGFGQSRLARYQEQVARNRTPSPIRVSVPVEEPPVAVYEIDSPSSVSPHGTPRRRVAPAKVTKQQLQTAVNTLQDKALQHNNDWLTFRAKRASDANTPIFAPKPDGSPQGLCIPPFTREEVATIRTYVAKSVREEDERRAALPRFPQQQMA